MSTTAFATFAASPKAAAYARDLIATRVLPAGWNRDAMLAVIDGTGIDAAQASRVIDTLKSAPRTPRTVDAAPVVPAGRYATASRTGANDLDFWLVKVPESGKWAGRTFVDRVIGGQGNVPVTREEQQHALAAITAAGVEASRMLFANELGRCWKCGRELTDEASRAAGIGPTCAGS
jgi:hypothetical protein